MYCIKTGQESHHCFLVQVVSLIMLQYCPLLGILFLELFVLCYARSLGVNTWMKRRRGELNRHFTERDFEWGHHCISHNIKGERKKGDSGYKCPSFKPWGLWCWLSCQTSPGFSESRVCEGPDEADLLPSLSRLGLRQTLLHLLLQRHEGLPGQPSRPGPRVAEPYR